MVSLGHSIAQILQWFDSFPVVAHLQDLNAEHLPRDAFLVEPLTKAYHGFGELFTVN